MSVYNIINTIRKRSGMYLGSNSITALWHFLDGYQAALRDNGICSNRELFPLDFRYMSEFTNVRLGYSGNMGWHEHILGFFNGDEEKALAGFFELFDEFIQIRMKKYWRAILTKDNIEWHNSMEHVYRMEGDRKKPVFINPVVVYVVELTIPAYIAAVETRDWIQLERRFFTSLEQAKGNGRFPEGAERYFGKIESWEEFSDKTVGFKNKDSAIIVW